MTHTGFNAILYRLKSDIRLSVISLLWFCSLVAIGPFAVIRFLNGNIAMAMIDLGIVLGISGAVGYAWISGKVKGPDSIIAFIICGGAISVGVIQGYPGVFWIFPCIAATVFLTTLTLANILNVVSVIALMVGSSAFDSPSMMWSFASAALALHLCMALFAIRNRRQQKRLHYVATVDPLTGIKNRRSMDEALALATATARRTGTQYAAVVIDLDHFKAINDRFGHAIGDVVLQESAELIRNHIRKSDQLFRFGGEEFLLLATAADGPGIETLVRHIRQSMDRHLKHPGGGHVTASFGSALLQEDEDVDGWMQRADAAMYRAKASGRDCLVRAEDMSRGACSKLDQ